MIKTACGLDCPDACGIVIDPAHFPRMAADTNNGALCALLNKDLFETGFHWYRLLSLWYL